jgi:hypothetical protein
MASDRADVSAETEEQTAEQSAPETRNQTATTICIDILFLGIAYWRRIRPGAIAIMFTGGECVLLIPL